MKPLLTHSSPPLTATLPACLLPMTRLLTTKEQRNWVRFFLRYVHQGIYSSLLHLERRFQQKQKLYSDSLL